MIGRYMVGHEIKDQAQSSSSKFLTGSGEAFRAT
jgi:hypothetical protein